MKRQRTHWNQTQTDSDMIGMLQLSDQEFTTIMLRAPMDKVDST